MSDTNNPFLEEAYELIAELENALLELEENPDDMDLIGRVFRAMHTIKGSGAMFGYENIAEFTHELETAFDLVREGKLPVTTDLVNLSLSARDQIKAMLDASVSGDSVDDARSQTIIGSLQTLISSTLEDPDDTPAIPDKKNAIPVENSNGQEPEADDPDSGGEMSYRIRFKPNIDIFRNGTNPILLLKELKELGPCRVIAQMENIPALDSFDPEACFVYWDIILTTSKGINSIEDVFIFVGDNADIAIDVIDDSTDGNSEVDYKMLGQILLERGDLTEKDLEGAVNRQKRIGEILIESEAIDPGVVESALAEQKHIKQSRKTRQETATAASIRVPADKLDVLVDLVGELVTVQARLSQKAALSPDTDLMNIAEVVERLTGELRDNTMSIRMLPIGSTFNKLRRLVRDLSNELGKDVVMETEGGETELDKTVIEQLNDPLVHIIRNSIDHGIESPDKRQASAKPRQGTVRLSAEHSGANVLIRIMDDGAGLDAESLREKAIKKGIIGPDAEMTEKEIFGLIFAPGFSTAASVSSVSGRGVGMDVVKRSVERLRGHVEIDSIKGKGTTITLKLPLTLAIIDGLLVEIQGAKYVLPLSAIEECVELSREDVKNTHGRNILNIRGAIVPYVQLRESFGISGEPPDIEQVIINQMNGQRIGIVVDRVIGEHQIVIKTMSRLYQNVEEVSGATILGDGTVALILDVQKLIRDSGTEQRAAA
jgi:two-component system, chemotaxis family, sensor kinase CheA